MQVVEHEQYPATAGRRLEERPDGIEQGRLTPLGIAVGPGRR
jgi:hypothetical protein